VLVQSITIHATTAYGGCGLPTWSMLPKSVAFIAPHWWLISGRPVGVRTVNQRHHHCRPKSVDAYSSIRKPVDLATGPQ